MPFASIRPVFFSIPRPMQEASMTITATAPVAGIERTKINAIVFASCLGTIIEWYDFLIYATAAALVFNKAFFPTFDPLAGTLAALGSYAVGFLARPLGGALFGDRKSTRLNSSHMS